jgi:hypothetical protein
LQRQIQLPPALRQRRQLRASHYDYRRFTLFRHCRHATPIILIIFAFRRFSLMPPSFSFRQLLFFVPVFAAAVSPQQQRAAAQRTERAAMPEMYFHNSRAGIVEASYFQASKPVAEDTNRQR